MISVPTAHRAAMRGVRPTTPAELHGWLAIVLGIEVPRHPIDDGADAPFDYLCHTFFEPPAEDPSPRDALVWACRGGGKTFYAALATALELVFKPGIEIKVLGGSLEQSQRMHAHLRAFLERPELRGLVDGRVESRRVRLRNGSSAEVLAQSHTSVRGARPQKLRCDEVELFDPEVWEAAQLVPRSAWCGGIFVRGAVEALSTMHAAHGLMARLTTEAAEPGAPKRLFRWGVTDVLEHCPEARACALCPLLPECQGRAKRRGGGHMLIDDAIHLKQRVSSATWDAEMRCIRPSRRDAVFPEFDRDVHVSVFDEARAGPDPWRSLVGLDFGFRAPTAILWAALDRSNVLHVIDERIQSEVRLSAHIESILQGGPRRLPAPVWVACDPAGHQRSLQTGLSDITQLRRAGLMIRAPRLPIERGLEAIRARLAPASGPPTLWINPRCEGLIRALEQYHYRADPADDPRPVKDGPDHAIDALRYLVATIDLVRGAEVRVYW